MSEQNQPTEQEIQAFLKELSELDKECNTLFLEYDNKKVKIMNEQVKLLAETKRNNLNDEIEQLRQRIAQLEVRISLMIKVLNEMQNTNEIKSYNFDNIINSLLFLSSIYSDIFFDYDKALTNYQNTYNTLQIIQISSKSLYLTLALIGISIVYLNTNKYSEGINILENILKTKNYDNHFIINLYNTLSSLYMNAGNYRKSIYYSEKCLILIDKKSNENDYYALLYNLFHKLIIFNFNNIETHTLSKDFFSGNSIILGAYYTKKYILSKSKDSFQKAEEIFQSLKESSILGHEFNSHIGLITLYAYKDMYCDDNKKDNDNKILIELKNLSEHIINKKNEYINTNDFNSLFIETINKSRLHYHEIAKNLFYIISLLKLPMHQFELTKYTHTKTFDIIYRKNEKSNLRINDAREMNDANEGKLLYEFLIMEKYNNPNENAFISSFTLNNGDAMQMWQTTYGDACKGISYTSNSYVNQFSQQKINTTDSDKSIPNIKQTKIMSYFKVAYYDKVKKTFNVYDYDSETKNTTHNINISRVITQLFHTLERSLISYNKTPQNLQPLFSFLSYLIKDIGWHYENEVRLIHISTDPNDPKIKPYEHDSGKRALYYDTERPIYPHKVTLGPKFQYERQALGYYQNIFDNDIDVTISEFPYNFPPQ